MNWEQIKGGWKRMTDWVKGTSSELTEDELTIIAERRDQLIGFLQESYGFDKEQAAKELDEFTRGLETARSRRGNVTATGSARSECFGNRKGSISQAPMV